MSKRLAKDTKWVIVITLFITWYAVTLLTHHYSTSPQWGRLYFHIPSLTLITVLCRVWKLNPFKSR